MKMRARFAKWLRHSIAYGLGVTAVYLIIAKRSSYTDISAQSGYIGQLQVAQIPNEIAVEACKKLERALPECPVVLRVKAAGEMEYLFGDGRQKVRFR